MSLAVTIPELWTYDANVWKFTLRDPDPNASSSAKLVFDANKHIQERGRVELFRGTLTSGKDRLPNDVVCKFAYGRRALEGLENEARLYLGKLKGLQGKFIPRSYGYFIGDTKEGPTGCLVLEYCGEPLHKMLQYIDPAFRDAVIDAVDAIHKAGVKHRDLDPRNVLNYNGRPILIDFDKARDHQCTRGMPMVKDATEPPFDDFSCSELDELCRSSNFWKPRYIVYARTYKDVALASDAHTLAATAPAHWPKDYALQTAYHAIIKHPKAWYPDQYDAWVAKMDSLKQTTPSASVSICSIVVLSRTPFYLHESPSYDLSTLTICSLRWNHMVLTALEETRRA